MEYSHKIESGILKLSLEGDLIGEVKGPELLEVINRAKFNQEIKFCAIDISKVRYINSSGIGVLITMLTKFRNRDGEVCLINPSEHVKKLLIITKLTAIFNIVDTMDEAVQKLQS
jgi:anti-sigma B factor antagonist